MPLKLKELQDPTLIVPIDAYAPDKEALQKMLRNYPLTKRNLVSILKSDNISKDEIKEIFERAVSITKRNTGLMNSVGRKL